MNDIRNDDLAQRIQSIDHSTPFDATDLAARVVAERSRRRRLRTTVVSCVLIVTATIGLLWQGSDPANRHPSVVNFTKSNQVVKSAEDALSELTTQSRRQYDEVQTHLSQPIDQRRFKKRLARFQNLIAAAETKRQEQQLTFFRAEASKHIEMPDLTRFYHSPPRDPSN